MSYQKYLGDGVILGMSEYGESGRILRILTREGIRGLVATGVRELKSKMRSEIDVLTKVEFEYVEGKEVARLVGIFPKEKLLNLHDPYVLENILQIRNVISNVTNFVLRTVVGETPNESLYESFLQGLKNVQNKNMQLETMEFAISSLEKESQNLQVQKIKSYFETLEIVWLIKILISLGYWEENLHDKFDKENMQYVFENRKELIEKINNSIQSSHM